MLYQIRPRSACASNIIIATAAFSEFVSSAVGTSLGPAVPYVLLRVVVPQARGSGYPQPETGGRQVALRCTFTLSADNTTVREKEKYICSTLQRDHRVFRLRVLKD